MEARYRRDLNHSYLVIEGIGDEVRKNYQYKMILKNRIPGLLSCEERYMNGATELLFDISARQAIRQIYEVNGMRYRDILGILQGLNTTLVENERFLLDSENLVLEPSYIFMDAEMETCYFVFLPGYENRTSGIFVDLAEFFLTHTNHRDDRAVSIVYRFYNESRADFFSLPTFLELLEEKSGQIRSCDETDKKSAARNRHDMNQEAGEEWTGGHRGFDEGDREEVVRNEWESKIVEDTYGTVRKEDSEKALQQVSGKGWLIASMMLVIAFGGLIAAYLLLPLPRNERITLTGMLAGVWFLLLIAVVQFVRGIKEKGRDPEEADEVEESVEEWEMSHEPEAEQDETYGETKYLVQNGRDGIKSDKPKIIREFKGKKQEWVLDPLPLTVGKLKQKTDLVISDESVSRIHARFLEKGGKTAIIDLNSTNGTSVNGIKLDPQEIVVLEDDDEIEFGSVLFLFYS